MTSGRLTDRSTSCLRAPLLAAMALALLTQVAAQESSLPTPIEDANPVRLGAPASLRGAVAPGQPVAGAKQRLPWRPKERRSRSATAAPVRAPTRVPIVARNLVGEVQPVIVGLPDAELPLVLRRKRTVEIDPYGSLGYRIGGVSVFPAIEESVGYDTNPNRSSGAAKKGSLVSRTEGEVRLRSDWLAHELVGFLRGSYSYFTDVDGANRPEGEGRIALRLDAARDTQIELESRFLLDTERPGDPDLGVAVLERPLVATAGASAGVTQRFNRLALGLRGTLDRTVYEDASLPNGTILDRGDRDANQYGVRLRAGYELHPGFIPFVEGLADTRVYDRTVDNAGFRRSSEGLGVRAGSTFEISRLLTGEASAGIQTRRYDDPRLKDLTGPLAEAALVWAATPLTTLRLRGQSQIEDTTIPFSSGALAQRATFEVQHDFRRNLGALAAVTFSNTDYRGVRLKEEGFAGSVKLDYRMTRSVALRASFIHERLKSTSPGADYTANIVLLGLRFQP